MVGLCRGGVVMVVVGWGCGSGHGGWSGMGMR